MICVCAIIVLACLQIVCPVQTADSQAGSSRAAAAESGARVARECANKLRQINSVAQFESFMEDYEGLSVD